MEMFIPPHTRNYMRHTPREMPVMRPEVKGVLMILGICLTQKSEAGPSPEPVECPTL